MANSDKNIRITTSKNKTTFPNIVFTGSSAGTSVLTLEVRDDNTVAFTGTDGDVFSLDYNLSTGTIWSVNDKSGTPFLRASAGGTIGIAEFGTGVLVGIGQTNPRYKLDVQGWAGFASTGDGSYTVLVENGLTTGNNALSIRAANALRFYNSNNSLYTAFVGAQSGVNTTYTLPPTSPSSIGASFLTSTQAGVLAWVAAPAGGTGSGTVNSGAATYAAYYATSTTAVSQNANLQFTGTGLSVGGNINSSSTITGSIYVWGGLGITGNAFIGGTAYIPSTTPSNISNLLVSNSTASTSTSSGALVIAGGSAVGQTLSIGGSLNIFSGASLYTGFKSAQSGVNTTYTLPSTTPSGTATSYLSSSVDGVMAWVAAPISGGSGSVNSGTATYAAYYATTTNAVSQNANLQFTGSGVSVGGNINSTSTTTGSLLVWGGLGITGNAFIGGTAYIPSTTPSNISNLLVSNSTVSTSTSTGALVVSGGAGIAGSLFTGIGFSSSISGVVMANGNVAATTYNKLTLSTPANAATLTLANNSTLATSGAFSLTLTTTAASNVTFPTAGTLITTGATSPDFLTSITTGSATFAVFNTNATTINAFGAATTLSVGASTGTFTHNSTDNSTATNTGSLVVLGGAGIAKSVSIGGSLNIFNGANYTGFKFAGSANTTYTLPPRTPTGTGASYLSSSIDGVMAWVAAPTSGSATPGGTNDGDIQYKSGSSFAAATTLNYDTNIGQLSVSSFPLSSVSSTSAALKLLGTSQSWTGSSLGSFLAINAAVGFVGDLMNAQVNGASVFQLTGSGNLRLGAAGTGFTLPTTNGTSGQVLTANTGGVATWTTVSSTGAGSGTVAIPGAQYQVAAYYWSATGASVSGSSTFTNNTSTGIARITHTTPSTSTSTGALVVDGSVGVGGSLYIGGQINQTYQPVTGAAIDHAIFIQSTPVPTTVGSLIQIGPAAKWDGTTAGYFTGSFSGTYIGINAASGNTADFLNFQQNGQPVFKVGAGGTTFQIGQPLDYAATDVLASFKSTVNSYAQFIIQNKSSGAIASADFVLNNDQSTDTTFFGNLGMNSSGFSGAGALAAPNAVYLTSTSSPLVLATTTQHPIRILTNGTTTDLMYIHESGTAISVFTNLDLRAQNDIRFFNATNTNFAALQASNVTTNYTLSLPTAPVGAGASVLVTGSDSNMYFAAPGGGIAFSTVTGNLPTIRAKRSLNLQFASGFTPLAAGVDNVVIRVPDSPTDGTSLLTYVPREFYIRVETPSAGSSRIQLERSTGTGAFTLAATGSSYLGGLGLTISGAGIYVTSTTTFAGAFITSGDNLRLNWSLLNATHANFSVQLLLEEV